MTAAERLLQLAGATGTAAVLLLAIGTGVTSGEALVDYSGLTTGTAAEHLLTDVAPPSGGSQLSGGGGAGGHRAVFGRAYPGYDARPTVEIPRAIDTARALQEDDEEGIIVAVLAEAAMLYYT